MEKQREKGGRSEFTCGQISWLQVAMVCITWEGFGAWFGGKASGPDHLHLQLSFLIHQTNLNITCRGMKTKLLVQI